MDSFDQMHHQDGITIKNTFVELRAETVNLRRSKSDSCLLHAEPEMPGSEHSGEAKRKRRVPVNRNTVAVMFDVPEGMGAADLQNLLDQCDAELNCGRRSFDCLYCPTKKGKVIGYCEVNFLDHEGVMRAIQRLAFTRFNGCKTIRFSQKLNNDGSPLQGQEFIDRYMKAENLMCQGSKSGLLFFGNAHERALQAGYGRNLQKRCQNKRGCRGKNGALSYKNISSKMHERRDEWLWCNSSAACYNSRNPSDNRRNVTEEEHRHWSSDNSTTCPEEIQYTSEEDIAPYWPCGEEGLCWSTQSLEWEDCKVQDWWSCSMKE